MRINNKFKDRTMTKSKKSGNFILQSNWVIQLIPYVLITIAAIIVYSNSFDCVFQFDDSINITENQTIRDLDNFKDLSLWTNVNLRPLSMFSFALNYYFGNLNVRGYHTINLIIHILTSFIVFLFIKKIITLSFPKNISDKQIGVMSLFVAIIFSIHPIQTQAVTYIVQRMTSMAGLFYILSVYLYTIARQKQMHEKLSLKVLIVYFLCFISFMLSILSKQTAITIPLTLILIEICFIRNKSGEMNKRYIFIFISILIIVFSVIALTGNLPRETDKISRFDYLLTQFRVMVKYIQLLLLPINQNLDHDVLISNTLWRFPEISSFLIICFLIFFSIKFFKRNKLITFAIAWFFITQALESTIFPITDLMYEHRLYLATIGFSLIIVNSISYFLKDKNKLITILLIIISASYGYATFQRNKVWKTKYSLWSDIIEKSPNKARPNFNMGNRWADEEKYEMAVKYYTRAIEIDSNFVQAYTNLGSALNYMGEKDKALTMFEKAIKLDSNHLKALQNLGILHFRKGNLEEAKKYYKRYTELDNTNAKAYNFLGTIYGRQKDYIEAEKCFNLAHKLEPNFTDPMKNLSMMYSHEQKYDKAKEMYEKLLKIEPQNAQIWYELGLIWSEDGDNSKAIKCYHKALDIQPDFEKAKMSLRTAMNSINSGIDQDKD